MDITMPKDCVYMSMYIFHNEIDNTYIDVMIREFIDIKTGESLKDPYISCFVINIDNNEIKNSIEYLCNLQREKDIYYCYFLLRSKLAENNFEAKLINFDQLNEYKKKYKLLKSIEKINLNILIQKD